MHYKDPYAWDKVGLKSAFQDLERLRNFMEETTILGDHEQYGKLIEGFTNIDDELASMLDQVNTNDYEGDDTKAGLYKITGNWHLPDSCLSRKVIIDLFNLCVNLKSRTQVEEWKDAVRPKC